MSTMSTMGVRLHNNSLARVRPRPHLASNSLFSLPLRQSSPSLPLPKRPTGVRAKAQGTGTGSTPAPKAKEAPKAASSKAAPAGVSTVEEDGMEIGEESWVTEKIEDAKDVATAVVSAIPGPRVGSTSAPWLLVVPAAYLGITLVMAVVKTVQRFNSPRFKRRKQVNKNAGLMEALDFVLDPSCPIQFTHKEFKAMERQFNFAGDEIVRKYLRYAFNEKPFGPDVVVALIKLRKASALTHEEMAEVLNEVSRRTVKAKGPVVLDTAGFTEKGLQRKVAVQALFTKLLYLSELEEICSLSARGALQVKSIFGVTDEDAESIRIVSLSSPEDMERLDNALKGDSDGEGSLSSQED